MQKPSIKQLSAVITISIISLILGELAIGTVMGAVLVLPILFVMPFVVAYVYSLVTEAEFLRGEVWVVMAILYAGIYFVPFLTLSAELVTLIALSVIGSVRVLMYDKEKTDQTLAWSYLIVDAFAVVIWAVTYLLIAEGI